MCEICRSSICPSGCPNYEPKEVYTCKICGEPIEEGEEYYEMDAEFYHEDCFEDNAVRILMDDCGAMKGVAEMPEPDWEDRE